MAQVALECKHRQSSGKGVARKLRAAGRIPGVLYGKDTEPVKIDLEEKAVQNLLRKYGVNPIIDLSIEGLGDNKHVCMIADYQRDVFQRSLLHLDLRRVDLSQKVIALVPLRVHGEIEVRARGGITELRLDNLHVRALPLEIPPAFDLDVTRSKPGEHITVADIPMPAGVEVLHEPEEIVLNIMAPRKGGETTAEGAEAGAEAPAAEG